MNVEITPVATVRSPFTSKFGIPRQSGLADVESRVVLAPPYRSPEAIREIGGFSHLWLIWGFSQAPYKPGTLTVRPPRLGGNRRVGVFASRSPYRPNSLGLSCVRLLRVETDVPDGPVLVVGGADLLDGTPVYDIKPYLPYADCVPDALGGYADAVRFADAEVRFACDVSFLSPDRLARLRAVLAGDPRPHYQTDADRVYAFEFDGLHIAFTVEDGTVTAREVTPL